MLIDAHCHLHEFKDSEIRDFIKDTVIAAVSDDLKSSRRTLQLAMENPNRVLAFIGIHPWEIGEAKPQEIEEVIKLAEHEHVAGIGEVGLDKKFVKETFNQQLKIFTAFVKTAKEYDLPMNVHAPDAWRDVLDILRKHDVERAIIHWYTGPLELLEEMEDMGYYITVNPAITIQKKHREVVAEAPLSMILVESDGPYNYRGLNLTPKLIPKTINEIAKLKEITPKRVEAIIESNFKRFIRRAIK